MRLDRPPALQVPQSVLRCTAAAVIAAVLAGCAPSGGDGDRVTVLAASSLTAVFEDIEQAFEARHPEVDVVVSTGGSPTLAAQASDRAPAALLVTADEESMRTAVEAGVVEGDPLAIASNRVVLARPNDPSTPVTSPEDFGTSEPVIVLCGPDVPCGRSAAELLAALGVTADADSLESSVQGVVTRLRLGEADAGVVYRTDVTASDGALVALDDGAPETVGTVRYMAGILTEEPGGRDLLDFITSSEGRRLLSDRGFGSP